jgi:hypothetical protein
MTAAGTSVSTAQAVKAARAIGLATMASGAGLLLAPSPALRLMGARTADPAPYLFRIVGMFMACSGGLLADDARSGRLSRLTLRWSLAQKGGAATAMSLGVAMGHYRPRALSVAAFDAGCAVVLAVLARPLTSASSGSPR